MVERIMWSVVGLCAVCAVLGVTVGMYLSRWALRRQRAQEAPLPEFDPRNPMNAGRGRETISAGGATWYVIRPQGAGHESR